MFISVIMLLLKEVLMDKRYTDSEYLFKNFLLSKLNLKATYLDIPDNNCFYMCISEVIKNLSLNIEKNINDYSNALIKNFYNCLIKDFLFKEKQPAVYGALLSKLKNFLDSNKISKKELFGFLLDVRKRNSLSYFKMVYSEVEAILSKDSIDNVEYSINIFNTLLNEIIARGTDIRFLNFSLSEIDTNPTFEEFINYVKYIAEIKPYNKDILDILVPIRIDKEKDIFTEICDKRNQKYEIIDDVIYCKIYDCDTNDFFTLIEDQMVRISSIFDLIKLYTYHTPEFESELPIKIKSKILNKEFEIPFNYIIKYTGNKPYSKHLNNTITTLDAAKETDTKFYHQVLNTLSYAEKDLNKKNSNAFVDNWIALETLCSISEFKSGYEAVQFYVPKMIITTIVRQNITAYLIKAYKNYFKDIKLEEFLKQINNDNYEDFLNKIPNAYNRFILSNWAKILNSPLNLYQYINRLQDKINIDILRIYILRNEYVHSCNLNAFQALEFYKLKNIFNIVIDEFFRCLTNRRDKDQSFEGIGFDIFNQFTYKWDIMLKSLNLMFKAEEHTYKSDVNKIVPDKTNINIKLEGELTYSDYLLNLLKNNNEILKKYVPKRDYKQKDEDADIVENDFINIFNDL